MDSLEHQASGLKTWSDECRIQARDGATPTKRSRRRKPSAEIIVPVEAIREDERVTLARRLSISRRHQ